MRTLIPFLVLALGAVLPAQTHATVPAGFLTKTGGGNCIYPLVHYFVPGVRLQTARPGGNKKVLVIKALSYRTQTKQSYTTVGGTGRTWSNLALSVGYTNAAKMSATFSLNPIGKMTNVYNGKWSVPTQSAGIPTQTWGNAGTVAFSTLFLYNGKNDILEDWVAAPGKMANGFTGYAQYWIDDCPITANAPTFITVAPGSTTAPGSKYVPKNPTGSGCGGHPSLTADAFALAKAKVYADNHATASLAGKFDVTLESYFTRPSAAVIGILTFGGNDAGTPFAGAKCNKLHINTAFQILTSVRTASGTGFYTHVNAAVGPKYETWFKGLSFYWQSAWAEPCSGSGCVGQLGLSIASKLVMPAKPGAGACPGGVSVYRFRNTSGTWSPSNTNAGYGVFRVNSLWKGIVRYGKS